MKWRRLSIYAHSVIIHCLKPIPLMRPPLMVCGNSMISVNSCSAQAATEQPGLSSVSKCHLICPETLVNVNEASAGVLSA